MGRKDILNGQLGRIGGEGEGVQTEVVQDLSGVELFDSIIDGIFQGQNGIVLCQGLPIQVERHYDGPKIIVYEIFILVKLQNIAFFIYYLDCKSTFFKYGIDQSSKNPRTNLFNTSIEAME